MSIAKYNAYIAIAFIISMGIFIVTFLLIVNRRISYLNYISREIKRICKYDLGDIIDVKGKDELSELCMSINFMSKELKKKFDEERENENIKNELITNISHDLRSPLTSIIGYIDLIKKRNYKNEAQFNDYIETIYNKANNLKQLINELFEYNKLSSPEMRLNYKKVDLISLLEQIIGENVPMFKKEGLTLNKDINDEEIIVSIDIDKIVRVFENLLVNALKYSIKPSEVRISLQQLDTKVKVSIKNKVNKFEVNNIDKLFERFYKVDTSRSFDSSSGLGLAIARKIIELHGGKIWAEYSDNYITFNIELNLILMDEVQ